VARGPLATVELHSADVPYLAAMVGRGDGAVTVDTASTAAWLACLASGRPAATLSAHLSTIRSAAGLGALRSAIRRGHLEGDDLAALIARPDVASALPEALDALAA